MGTELFAQALPVMGIGYLGVFGVIAVIISLVTLLNRWGRK